MKVPIAVVIPARVPVQAEVTLESLRRQTVEPEQVLVVPDTERRGANWARNEGFEQVRTEFVLFSDDDIDWQPNAIELMLDTLRAHPEASYCYGAYEMDGWVQCDRKFSAAALRKNNYISTMSLIRSKDFPGFDEAVTRLMDWDLWLTMLEQGKIGVYCGQVIFRTKVRAGITYAENALPYEIARAIVAAKHGLEAA